MMQNAWQNLAETFYYSYKEEFPTDTKLDTYSKVCLSLKVVFSTINEEDIYTYLDENIPQNYGISERESILQSSFVPWLETFKINNELPRYKAYEKYLYRDQKFNETSVNNINDITDKVLDRLINPNEYKQFEKKGLVIGDVQSGKTANYIGLVNKAIDVGYKLIIVVTGIHEDLRAQTQSRINEQVIGFDVVRNSPVGIEKYLRKNDITPQSITSTLEDFNKSKLVGKNFSKTMDPMIFVLKKNGSVLRNFLNYMKGQASTEDGKVDLPILFIDDEADQASLNTRKDKVEDDPTTINRLIRDILNIFTQNSYVAYTATPFANIFVTTQKHEEKSYDLFPKDFIISMPIPENYMGAEKFFGNFDGDNDYYESGLVQYINDLHITGRGTNQTIQNMPPKSLKNAIIDFVIATTIKRKREKKAEDTTMLVHIIRTKNSHKEVKENLNESYGYVSQLRNGLKFNKDEYVKEVRNRFDLFIHNQKKIIKYVDKLELNFDYQMYLNYEEIEKDLLNVLDKVKVLEVNSDSEDKLKYDNSGNVYIAIGGDKLSRGLTLEGLLVSYYFRNSKQYDTLMQMGRWFGYRGKYFDLCRVYIDEDIFENFRYVCTATKELRSQLDLMNKQERTPREFGLRIAAHPSKLLPTARNKLNAHKLCDLSGVQVQQTVMFDFNKVMENFNLTNAFIEKLEQLYENESNFFVNVDSNWVIDYLKNYKYPKTGNMLQLSPAMWAKYIAKVNEIDELTHWTVAVINPKTKSKKTSIKIGSQEFSKSIRSIRGDSYLDEDRVTIGVLTFPEALKFDKAILEKKGITNEYGYRPSKYGYLMLYPIELNISIDNKNLKNIHQHPEIKNQITEVNKSNHMSYIGLAIAFNEEVSDKHSEYYVNEVFISNLDLYGEGEE